MNYINKLLSYKRMIGISNRSIVLVVVLTVLSGLFETFLQRKILFKKYIYRD